jgi:hypothetical protein
MHVQQVAATRVAQAPITELGPAQS